ncbi:CWF19-like protein 2 isoform X2 [Bombina bombina]|nr:CWF19-like protein 2 isoform X2 [Bombina bombina]XP_053564540.1 CWF19-like protein 2 isoform X2 [Bombina bombina]
MERCKEWKRPRVEDSMNNINERSEVEMDDSGKKKKNKLHKKVKKEKKKKKKKLKHERNEDSSDSSRNSEAEWVEATVSQPSSTEKARKIEDSIEEQDVKRDEWMTLDFMSLKATSVTTLRAEKQKEKKLEHEKAQAVEKEKLQARELNPYWKDGGSGLPPEEGGVTSHKKVLPVEDGGLSWLRKAYQRMKEQSERENRNLENIVAERYGSMEIFQKKMEEAEKIAALHCNIKFDDRREKWRKSKYSESESRTANRPFDERTRDRYTDYARHKKLDNTEDQEIKASKPREGERISNTSSTSSEYRSYTARPSGDSDSRKQSQDKSSSFKQKTKFLKPTDDDGSSVSRSKANTFQQAPLKYSSQTHTSVKTDASWRKKAMDECGVEIHQSKAEDEPINIKTESDEKCSDNSSSHELSRQVGKQLSPRSDTQTNIVQILTEEDLNKLGAKIVKAELLGNMDLATKLKAQLEEARKQKESQAETSSSVRDRKTNIQESHLKEDQEVLLVRTDQSGRSWPVNATSDTLEQRGGRRKRQMATTHVDKERVRYFHDDDNQSLQDLVRREKMATSEDQNKLFLRMAAKCTEKTDQDYYTLDDMFVSKAAKKEGEEEEEERERRQAIAEHRKLANRMENCPYCFDNKDLPKHLVISIGVKVYLSLPNYVSLTDGHCLIVPLQHYTAATLLDEDIWNEIQMFRKALVKMFEARDLDCVFIESNIIVKKRFHLVYECIPLPKEAGDMAPIYFKKAIMESDEEWSMNKKLIDLSTKDIRRSVPKGLPYFSVDFGLQGGFAHVIENHHKFPHYFGKEIIGGMLDLEPRLWRKAVRENFDDQRKKVLQFAQWWKPYDFTKNKE